MIDQRLRDHAIDLPAALEHAVGDQAHQAEAPAAVDEVDAARSTIAARRRARRIGERRLRLRAPSRNRPRGA